MPARFGELFAFGCSGGIVTIKKTALADQGDIGALILDHEATLKQLS
ncbi:hypothetical protein QC334_33975 [Streptomyces sp. DH18]|nr:hypothetical protein [Streptomyces sp. DH18]MDG9687680.1 hypothetical protein [Streptomyces sp. DH18]